MASKKVKSEDNSSENKPKATARHAKIVRSKQDEIESFRVKIANDKHLAKKYEAKRKEEIKVMPKEDRGQAKLELKQSIADRKEAERRDKILLRDMVRGEKAAKSAADGNSFDEEKWVEGGKKNKKNDKSAVAEPENPSAIEEPVEESDIGEESEIVSDESPEEEKEQS